MEMTPQRRLTRIRIGMMTHPVFCAYAPLSQTCPIVWDSSLPTACTDGWTIRINPEFFMSLNERQAAFVLLHEVCHVGYQHLWLYRHLAKENMRLANVAMDNFINLHLVDMQAAAPSNAGPAFLEMPEIGIKPDPKYRGLSTEQIYRLLQEKAKENEGNGGDATDGMGEPHDQHDFSGAPQPGQGEDSDEGGGSGAEPTRSGPTQAQRDQIEQAMREGYQMAKRMGSESGAGVLRDLRSVFDPKQDWRELLREFVRQTIRGSDQSTWARPNRRLLASGVYMPGSMSEQMETLAVVFDTSGSTFYGDDLNVFMAELTAVISAVAPERTLVLHTDTRVQKAEWFERGAFDPAVFAAKGGGGTNLPVAFEWMAEHQVVPQACIVFTDGDTPFGQPQTYPVLWAIHSYFNTTAPWGQTINLK